MVLQVSFAGEDWYRKPEVKGAVGQHFVDRVDVVVNVDRVDIGLCLLCLSTAVPQPDVDFCERFAGCAR